MCNHVNVYRTHNILFIHLLSLLLLHAHDLAEEASAAGQSNDAVGTGDGYGQTGEGRKERRKRRCDTEQWRIAGKVRAGRGL